MKAVCKHGKVKNLFCQACADEGYYSTEEEKMSAGRYEIHTGRFGQYFYDTKTGKDVDLEEALAIMNKRELKEVGSFVELKPELDKLRMNEEVPYESFRERRRCEDVRMYNKGYNQGIYAGARHVLANKPSVQPLPDFETTTVEMPQQPLHSHVLTYCILFKTHKDRTAFIEAALKNQEGW